MTKLAVTLSMALVLSGCLSTHMKKYVGQPIEEAFITYGRPENVIEFPDGRRAYQFRYGGGSIMTPSTGTATATTFGNVTTVQSNVTPAMILNSPGCLITYITRKTGETYTIEEYRMPKQLVC